MSLPEIAYPKPPAQVAVYTDVLGIPLTIQFLLAFGGAELLMPDKPRTGSKLVAVVGLDKAQALADEAHRMQPRVPLAKRWLSACLSAEGKSVADIARTLRVTDVTVRKWLAK